MDKNLGFLLLGVEIDDEEAIQLEEVSDCLGRLTKRRREIIHAFGPPAKTPAARNVEIFMESVLFRTVASVQGIIVGWNVGNLLSGFLSARAFFETFAMVSDFQRVVATALDCGDLATISNCTSRQMFATRNQQLLDARPEFKATNIVTFIDKLDKRYLPARKVYDVLSERCHPNSPGTFRMFGDIDPENGVATYSDRKDAVFCVSSPYSYCLSHCSIRDDFRFDG